MSSKTGASRDLQAREVAETATRAAELPASTLVQPRMRLTAILLLLTLMGSVQAAESQEIDIGDSRIRLIVDSDTHLDAAEIARWVTDCGLATADYFGRFPVPTLKLHLSFTSGDGIQGKTYGYSRPAIYLKIGREVDIQRLKQHWILVHEMAHLAFPNVDDHRWLEEGMATYLEPIIRLRAGMLSKTKFWKDLARGLPQGQASPSDRGLAYDYSWGRTYWGGALFWFLVDLDLRSQSNNQMGVRTVFRGILARGGNIQTKWTLDDVIRLGDLSSGHHSLKTQADVLVYNGGRVDLPSLWERLGLEMEHRTPRYFQSQWSDIREGISQSS